ncbi:hypothetical protein [Pseudomonas phage vB_Pa-PAC2]
MFINKNIINHDIHYDMLQVSSCAHIIDSSLCSTYLLACIYNSNEKIIIISVAYLR